MDLLAHATTFVFTPTGTDRNDPRTHHFRVQVRWRGGDTWSVLWAGECWNGTGWEYEPMNTARDDAFLARTLFPLDEACEMAQKLADTVDPAGLTWAEMLAHRSSAAGS